MVLFHSTGDPISAWLSHQLADQVSGQGMATRAIPPEWMAHWDDPWQAPAQARQLQAWLSTQPVLVQGVDANQGLFLLGLASALQAHGGTAIVLHWRQATLRGLAQLAGAHPHGALPPPEVHAAQALLQHDRNLMQELSRLREFLSQQIVSHGVVALEDLLLDAGSPQGDAQWTSLQTHLPRLSQAVAADLRQELQGRWASLLGRWQEGPWWTLLQQESNWQPNLDARPSFLHPQVVIPQDSTNGPWVRLGRLPPLMREGESTQLGGTVLVPPGGNEGTLWLAQRQEATALHWRQPSPGVAKAHPGQAGSDAARFRLTRIHARAAQPIHLRHRAATPDATVTELARVDFAPSPRPRLPGLLVGEAPLGYTPIPKVACTSIKLALFQTMVGERYTPERGLGCRHIHDYFDHRSVDISGLATRLLVVRDPLKRFLSAFSNRVMHHRELSAEYLQGQPIWPTVAAQDWIFDPDIETFVERLPQYLQIPTIRHHFEPITDIVPSLAQYSRVYAFEELDAFAADVSRHVGRPLRLPHEQRGGPKLGLSALSHTAIEQLVRYYAQDYLALRALYREP